VQVGWGSFGASDVRWAVAMAEFVDELGYPREVTKRDVVSAFLKVLYDFSSQH
jgi:hypothetical protein